MNRRDLLKWGVLGGVSGSGCATLLSNPAGVGSGELPSFLAELDGAMARIGSTSLLGTLLPREPSEETLRRSRASDELARATFRSLLLAGSVQELPHAQLTDERVQQRLRDALPEFDTAMFGMTNMLEDLPKSQRADISKALRDDAALGPRIVRELDDQAAAFGVSAVQRRKLANIGTEVCGRLRQSPDLTITEFTGKVRKIEARHAARTEQERVIASQLASSMLWQAAEDEGRGGVGGEVPEVPSPSGPPCTYDADCPPGTTCKDYRELGDGNWTRGQCKSPVVTPKSKLLLHRERTRRAGQVTMGVGGILLGLGAAGMLIVGASGVGGSLSWAYGATIGVLLGGIGLIVLIIGALITAFA